MASMMAATPVSKWALIRPFFAVLLLHVLAVYLFTRGFLLTRTELSAYSHCPDAAAASPCSASTPHHPTSKPDADSERCWTEPAVGRLVIIVLDALRFDFVAPSTFFEERKPWMDKLPVLQKLASHEGSSARIFKAIADPPTTSLQRLKGLMTGGLPTFIDVGNSFGAPAIIEDNLIHQLVKNGKRVLMMGDDTWVQLFPDHFQESYPYPSFNVKDLDTVDNGAMEHLLPSLYKDDWDVLIAHFLGVDHAGHIFGVDSNPMVQKLEQYNNILEKVVEVLKNLSGPGDLHENSLLLVMGDHGQTINGDHGGGTAEEVETSLFAMSLRNPPSSVSSILDERFCKLDLDGEKMCISTFQQLDFAVTVAALLGIPFPFGSIGRVNPELYALSGGTWDGQRYYPKDSKSWSSLATWMHNYANTLCINSWQVKRYIDLYSRTSVIGLPSQDLRHIAELYSYAQANWSNTMKTTRLLKDEVQDERQDSPGSLLQRQISAYSDFLENVAELARSAWTEFNLIMMIAGLCVMLVSIFVHFSAIKGTYRLCQSYYPMLGFSGVSFRLVFSLLLVAIRAASFLSNSYILEEGRVASFLLGTTTILNLLHSLSRKKFAVEELFFLILNIVLRFGIEFGVSKQTIGSTSDLQFLSLLGIREGPCWAVITEMMPIIVLSILAFIIYKSTSGISYWNHAKYIFVTGTVLSYMLIAMHWVSESNLIGIPMVVKDMGLNLAPRLVYAVGFGLLFVSALSKSSYRGDRVSNLIGRVVIATSALISAWSSTVLILLGRQGPFVALLVISGAWCIIRSYKVVQIDSISGNSRGPRFDLVPIIQWNLLAVCLFFYTGHWCTFDGLRYGAAFIGFDDFQIIRQGLLLAIDTFGISHIIPILSLPFLVALSLQYTKSSQSEGVFFLNLTKVFLSYGLITAVTTTFTIICVTIQRRHLMVWGLFAPKYVFDVVGLLLTDVLICVASLYYY